MKVFAFIKRAALFFALVALGVNQAIANPGSSSSYFTFSFAGPQVSGSGDFWATANGDGTYTATSGSETDSATGETISLIGNASAPWGTSYSPSGAFYYDDQYQPNNDPIILLGGLMFTGANGLEVNLWSTGPDSYVYDGWTPGNGYSFGSGGTPITFAAEDPPVGSSVPEPATVALFGLGILGLALMRRKSI
ncbi:MAG: PEP-CTERM sorting domain-containing protein [Burkholderiaceae bacterium]|nr:PEP-CTERM sorting domain-containing protein [Burkholderiaceae bacterium]